MKIDDRPETVQIRPVFLF